MQRGAFIVFEGLDRCGKSTQSRKLAEALQKRQVRCGLGSAARCNCDRRRPCAPPRAPLLRALLRQSCHYAAPISPPIPPSKNNKGARRAVALPRPHDGAGAGDRRVPGQRQGARRPRRAPALQRQPLGEAVREGGRFFGGFFCCWSLLLLLLCCVDAHQQTTKHQNTKARAARRAARRHEPRRRPLRVQRRRLLGRQTAAQPGRRLGGRVRRRPAGARPRRVSLGASFVCL